MAGDYRLEGAAQPEVLDRIHALFDEVREERDDVDSTDLMLLETAVIEIAGNVVAHGRPAGSIDMTMTVAVGETDLAVRIRETGQPPPDRPSYAMPDLDAEHGRGLPLCAAILDTFDYRRVDHANEWHLGRRRSG